MADEMTPGEVRRSFERVEAAARATNDRIAETARDMVPAAVWGAEHRAALDKITHLEADTAGAIGRLERAAREHREALGREIKGVRTLVEREVEDLREEIKAMRSEGSKRSEITWQKIIGLIGALAALALVVVTMIGQSKGITP